MVGEQDEPGRALPAEGVRGRRWRRRRTLVAAGVVGALFAAGTVVAVAWSVRPVTFASAPPTDRARPVDAPEPAVGGTRVAPRSGAGEPDRPAADPGARTASPPPLP